MESPSPVAVVTVPFPAQGHLNQLLHLSLLLAGRGIPVHFAAPEPHLRELDVPAHASPDPDPSSPFPTHMQPLFEAFCDGGGARASLAALLQELSASHRRVVVLHDRMAAFAAGEAARLPNGEALGVHCLAASYNVGWMDPGHRLLREHGMVFHPANACATREFVALAKRMGQERRRAPGAGMVVNTCRALEGEFLDVLAAQSASSSDGHRLFAVGPLNPLLLISDDAAARQAPAERHECLEWLDRQPPSSVLYISFGTTSSLRAEQVRELAAALRDTNQRFVWALRDADRADLREPGGARGIAAAALSLLGAQGTTGVVVTGWAPQLEILAHGATAAFMSHCGWNSTVEGLSQGKAILAWPMHSDQPWDAELVCKYLGAGVLVRPWEERGDVTPAAAICGAIERVMRSEDGAAVRGRARALGEAVRAAVAGGGSSRRDLDDLVAYVRRSQWFGSTSILADHIGGWYLCQMEILECKKVPWPKPLITKVHKVDNCGWPKQEAAYECKINLMTGKTHQIRAQLAAIGAPIVGDTAYMTGALAAMANPSINPYGRASLNYSTEEEKAAAVEAWVACHGKEPKSVIGLQASEISWDYEGEHHYHKAGVPWWRQDAVESDLV